MSIALNLASVILRSALKVRKMPGKQRGKPHLPVIIVNSFEFGDNMTYDAVAMQEDIAKYGLYTYEDFAEYCERSVFEQYNMAMMKVGVGKGIYTYEHIVYLLTEIALNDAVQIID